ETPDPADHGVRRLPARLDAAAAQRRRPEVLFALPGPAAACGSAAGRPVAGLRRADRVRGLPKGDARPAAPGLAGRLLFPPHLWPARAGAALLLRAPGGAERGAGAAPEQRRDGEPEAARDGRRDRPPDRRAPSERAAPGGGLHASPRPAA